MSEKKTEHGLFIKILSESPMDDNELKFAFHKSIDSLELDERNLVILSSETIESNLTGHTKLNSKEREKKPSKIGELLSKSPGALGDLYAFVKNYKWWQIYIGVCGFILLATLMFKWFIRLLTGTF